MAIEPEQFFSEAEVWYIFDRLVNLSIDLIEAHLPHEFITTQNLLVDKDGEILLIDDCALEKAKFISEEYQLPLSPSEIRSLSDPNFKASRLKSIVWAIGLTTLSIATVTEIRSYYNENSLNFDYLKAKLKKIETLGYSSAFCEVMDACLKLKEDERASIESLHKYLKGNQPGSKKQKEEQANIPENKPKPKEPENPKTRKIVKGFTINEEGESNFKVLKAPKETKNIMLKSIFEGPEEEDEEIGQFRNK